MHRMSKGYLADLRFNNIFPNSIILVSPQNEILLLHRVKTSTSFASAHVFPGGHVSAQDGELPPINDIRRHEDSKTYRMSAIRECFEESGILLAKNNEKPGHLLTLTDAEREDGRHAIHQNQIDFKKWVAQLGGTPDLGILSALQCRLLLTIELSQKTSSLSLTGSHPSSMARALAHKCTSSSCQLPHHPLFSRPLRSPSPLRPALKLSTTPPQMVESNTHPHVSSPLQNGSLCTTKMKSFFFPLNFTFST